jgi:hypothetical protein
MEPRHIRIVVASPSDVLAERDSVTAVAEELNRGVAAELGCVLDVFRWETEMRSPSSARRRRPRSGSCATGAPWAGC